LNLITYLIVLAGLRMRGMCLLHMSYRAVPCVANKHGQ